MCERTEKNYQKLVDPPHVPYGTILGDPPKEKSKKKGECVQVVVCLPKPSVKEEAKVEKQQEKSAEKKAQ